MIAGGRVLQIVSRKRNQRGFGGATVLSTPGGRIGRTPFSPDRKRFPPRGQNEPRERPGEVDARAAAGTNPGGQSAGPHGGRRRPATDDGLLHQRVDEIVAAPPVDRGPSPANEPRFDEQAELATDGWPAEPDCRGDVRRVPDSSGEKRDDATPRRIRKHFDSLGRASRHGTTSSGRRRLHDGSARLTPGYPGPRSKPKARVTPSLDRSSRRTLFRRSFRIIETIVMWGRWANGYRRRVRA